MARNLVILSDGTGQQGGLFFDERRSNIYKLYRATRCGPDSIVLPEIEGFHLHPDHCRTHNCRRIEAVMRWRSKSTNRA
jgi:hypothetical protein